MTPLSQEPLVSTIGERCRVCYQCVRECPAKAIRIADRRAQVLPERCIGCSVCFKVCTQDAKRVLSAIEAVEALLAGPLPVAAILAPSFPAEFIRYVRQLVNSEIPVMGSVYVPSAGAARFMNKGEVPGCYVIDRLVETLQEEAKAPDKGKAGRLERAARQVAILKGLELPKP